MKTYHFISYSLCVCVCVCVCVGGGGGGNNFWGLTNNTTEFFLFGRVLIIRG